MFEPAPRQRLREVREKATAEREARETADPTNPDAGTERDQARPVLNRLDEKIRMLEASSNAVAELMPTFPPSLVEKIAVAVLRVALPLHETQHADAWKAAHERAVHFEWEAVKSTERVGAAEKEVERLRGVETKLRGHLDSIGAAHQEGISARRTLDAMRETEIFELNAQLAEATTLLGHFVNHEDQPCRLDHHGACQEHGGSSLRRCDVAAGRELLARILGGGEART